MKLIATAIMLAITSIALTSCCGGNYCGIDPFCDKYYTGHDPYCDGPCACVKRCCECKPRCCLQPNSGGYHPIY